MSPSAPPPAPALDDLAPRGGGRSTAAAATTREFAVPTETVEAWRRHDLLVELREAERDMWVRGGREALRRRAAALKSALAAGCSVQDVADALQVKPTDLKPWITPTAPAP